MTTANRSPRRQKPYSVESIQRALAHHELTRAIHLYSPPIAGGGGKWKVKLSEVEEPLFMTNAEAYALCVGLAAAEKRWKQADSLSIAETHEIREFVVSLIEWHYGCPLDDITGPEIERWVKDHCRAADGHLQPLRYDAVMDLLR